MKYNRWNNKKEKYSELQKFRIENDFERIDWDGDFHDAIVNMANEGYRIDRMCMMPKKANVENIIIPKQVYRVLWSLGMSW